MATARHTSCRGRNEWRSPAATVRVRPVCSRRCTKTWTHTRLVAHTGRIGYLPQRVDHLDDSLPVFECVRAAAPTADPQMVRANLARFLLTGDDIHRRVGDLSGGERFRVALARLLLAEPPHQVLILDEPTNSLDLNSVEEVISALENHHGGLVAVSHDDAFLSRLGIETRLELEGGHLTAKTPPRGGAGRR